MPPVSGAGAIETVRRVLRSHAPAGRRLADDTNFFEAGLTSARLTEALADLAAAGFAVTLVDLFTHPSVDELAGFLGVPAPTGPHRLPWQR
jgi:aryl carrier-like protein